MPAIRAEKWKTKRTIQRGCINEFSHEDQRDETAKVVKKIKIRIKKLKYTHKNPPGVIFLF